MSDLTKTLVLTIALPDFFAEDLPENADEYWDGDMSEAVAEAMSLITSTARLLIAHGDREGNSLFDMRAVIIARDVVDREPYHDEPEDERLTEMVEDWSGARAEEGGE